MSVPAQSAPAIAPFVLGPVVPAPALAPQPPPAYNAPAVQANAAGPGPARFVSSIKSMPAEEIKKQCEHHH